MDSRMEWSCLIKCRNELTKPDSSRREKAKHELPSNEHTKSWSGQKMEMHDISIRFCHLDALLSPSTLHCEDNRVSTIWSCNKWQLGIDQVDQLQEHCIPPTPKFSRIAWRSQCRGPRFVTMIGTPGKQMVNRLLHGKYDDSDNHKKSTFFVTNSGLYARLTSWIDYPYEGCILPM